MCILMANIGYDNCVSQILIHEEYSLVQTMNIPKIEFIS